MTAAAANLDPRTTLARPDLAERALEGVVRASAYRAARPMHCIATVADIDAEPGPGAAAPLDQLIFGEAFDVLLTEGDRMWGQARRDGVVGWIDAAALAEGAPLPTQTVSDTAAALPLNALLIAGQRGASEIGDFLADPVAVAETLLGAPHRLGGRTPAGTDCSGLVQQALYACGLAGPRYADQQAELGRPVDRSAVRRGDLVVWLNTDEGPWMGHSAFVLDEERVIHASGAHGAVVIEDFADAVSRYQASGFTGPVFRRL